MIEQMGLRKGMNFGQRTESFRLKQSREDISAKCLSDASRDKNYWST